MAASRASSKRKIVILGDSGVGKSSLLVRFVRNEFHENTRSTISAAYLTRSVEVEDKITELSIWDTAGQERFRSLNTPMYYRGASGAVIVYDLTDATSFNNARGWFTQLKMLGESNVQVALVGNKADKVQQTDTKTLEAQAIEFAAQNAMFHLSTSAKTGLNVEEVFKELAKRMPTKAVEQEDVVMLTPNGKKSSSSCPC